MNCNYEIVSLCDIKEFNKELALLEKLPWSQLTMPETLNIPKNKPSIKSINKIYINIKIDSLKIIETPLTPVTNSEGLFLTGKKLLIDGNICEKIVYTSCYPNNSLSSIEFRIPFSTYIVINHDADIHNDKFNIKTCIEDISATPLNKRTIFQSTNLFFFAKRISFDSIDPGPQPEIIYNKIIVHNRDFKEVATITFDLENKNVLIQSTGEIPNESLGSKEYFSLTLRSSDNFTKEFSSLQANSDATSLYNDLNNIPFDFTDSIELKYIDNLKVSITSLENKDHRFNPFSEENYQGIQNFNITEKGIVNIN